MTRRRIGGAALALAISAGAMLAWVTGHATAKPPAQAGIELSRLGTFATGKFSDDGLSGAEIPAWDAGTQRIFVVNGKDDVVDVLDASDPSHPVEVGTGIDVSPGQPNSVAVAKGLVAVAVQAPVKTDPGTIQVFDADTLSKLGEVTVGALPDMVAFTPNGRGLLVANEGEPNTNYSVDPEGSVSVVDVTPGPHDTVHLSARTAGFGDFARADLPAGVRIFGLHNPTVAQDLEPEYVAISHDGQTAWATLQENNAIAEIDVSHARVTAIRPLGTKDHGVAGNGLDASDRDGPSNGPAVNIATWPVHGLYLPDTIAAIRVRGETFLLTANEGDAREYEGLVEETRVSALTLDPIVFPNRATLRQNAQLGRLNVTTAGLDADPDHDGDIDVLYSFGARSLSIWRPDATQVWDSGDAFERLTSIPGQFNATHDDNATWDSRSDNKGPEPEGLTVGEVNGKTYAFVAFERIGGIAVYDVTDPTAPVFIQYLNNRTFTVPVKLGTGVSNPAAGDLGPEGLVFVPASESPVATPLLVAANEISGTTTIYAVGSLGP